MFSWLLVGESAALVDVATMVVSGDKVNVVDSAVEMSAVNGRFTSVPSPSLVVVAAMGFPVVVGNFPSVPSPSVVVVRLTVTS